MLMVRRVAGTSMAPALQPGAIILAWKRPSRIVPGDIVVLHHEGLEKIKRVHRTRGQDIYVLGDNPAVSADSRSFGWLNRSTVVARVWWPRRSGPAA